MNVILDFGTGDEDDMTGKPHVKGTYRVDFSGATVGHFTVNESGQYVWCTDDPALAALFPKSRFSELPATVHNLHPNHGIFGDLLNIDTKEELIGTQVMKALSELRLYKIDDLTLADEFATRAENLDFLPSPLSETVDGNQVFTGTYTGPVGMAGTDKFNSILSDQWIGRFNFRFSGKQTKMPGHKNGDIISPALGKLSFTHFIKYPMAGGREADGLLEWAGLRMARAAGLKVNDFALIDQGDDLPPALAVERFDIPKDQDALSKEWVLMQDFYSILGEDPMNDRKDTPRPLFRYEDLLGGWIAFCNKHDPASTEKNAHAFLTRLVSAWASNDADLHAKNLSALIRIDPATKTVNGVDFSPTYDACVSTMCGMDGEPMFYNLAAKKGQPFEPQPPRVLNMNDFLGFLKNPKLSVDGKPYCIFDTAEQAQDFIRDVASKVAREALQCCKDMPAFTENLLWGPVLRMEMQQVAAIAIKRAKSVGADVPDVTFAPDLSKAIQKYGAKNRRNTSLRDDNGHLYNEILEKTAGYGATLPDPVIREKDVQNTVAPLPATATAPRRTI